jgi:prepilin-type N-terminal cleavage/methylation domain-containing protein
MSHEPIRWIVTDQEPDGVMRRGITLIELMASIVILSIVAFLVIPRFSSVSFDSKKNACYTFKGNIEIQAQLWYRNRGSWPAANLSDIGANTNYFPDGIGTCPVDGSAYTFDSASQQVVGHSHDE